MVLSVSHQPVKQNIGVLEEMQADSFADDYPAVPRHSVALDKSRVESNTTIAPEIAGQFVANQALTMSPGQFQLYSQALEVLRAPGPLRRQALISATRMAVGRDGTENVLGVGPLQVSDPFDLALVTGLLRHAAAAAAPRAEADNPPLETELSTPCSAPAITTISKDEPKGADGRGPKFTVKIGPRTGRKSKARVRGRDTVAFK